MNTANLIYAYRYFLTDKIKKKVKKCQKIIEKSVVFCIITEFLDDDSLLEVKFVCKHLYKKISSNTQTDYRVLKTQFKRVKMIKVYLQYFNK
jgi:hypothetical protein